MLSCFLSLLQILYLIVTGQHSKDVPDLESIANRLRKAGVVVNAVSVSPSIQQPFVFQVGKKSDFISYAPTFGLLAPEISQSLAAVAPESKSFLLEYLLFYVEVIQECKLK